MTDEEKKAIDKLKRSANYFVMPMHETTIILNLIEKQEKIIRDKEQIHEYDVKMIDEVKGEYVKLAKEDGEIIERQEKEIKLAKQSLKENAKIADERNQLLVENQKKDKIIQAIAFTLADYVMHYKYDRCRNPEMIKQKAKELIEYFEKKVGE